MILRELREDAVELTRVACRAVDRRRVLRTIFANDSFAILLLWRLRTSCRRLRIPFVTSLLRRVQTVVFGVEIAKEVTLGRGVYFVHPIGIVVGGHSRVGDRVKFLGSNTLGTVHDDGYPELESDVIVGVGARVLGPIRIGRGTVIGANAVVLQDLPPGSVAVGVPARIVRTEAVAVPEPASR
jgi:serine O-acetyltransferase